MPKRVIAHFQFQQGDVVRCAGDPARPYRVSQLRLTVRDILPPVLEVGIAPYGDPEAPLLRWEVEADCTPWRWSAPHGGQSP